MDDKEHQTPHDPNQPAGSNRRSAVRKPPRGRVTVECRRGTTGLGANIGSMVWDLSQTGACMVTTAPLKKGEEVELQITGTNMPKTIKIHADVVWTEALDAQRYSVGLRFHKPISWGDIAKLT